LGVPKFIDDVALFLGAFVLFLTTVAPGPGWLDTSELIAGAHTLGIVHPPGHPLWVMLAKAASLFPIGSIGFRVNVLSALLGALACCFVARIVRDSLRHIDPERRVDAGLRLSAVAAGALFGVTGACWLQSVRAEVYSLNATLTLAAIWFAVRWLTDESPRWLLGFAVVFGLGLTNHHYLMFFVLPGPIVVLLSKPSGRAWAMSPRACWAVVLVLIALAAYAYLPIRALTDPVINWSDPRTASRFWDVLTAKTFQVSVSGDTRGISVGENLAVALGMFIEQLSVPAFLTAIAGLLLLVRRAPIVAVLFTVTLLANLMTKGLMFIDPDNPDDYGYFMAGIALFTVFAGVMPTLLIDGLRASGSLSDGTAVKASACGGITLAAMAAMVAVTAPVDRSQDTTAEVLADAILAPAEANAVVLVRHPGLFFNQWYAQLVDGKRPDVAVIQETFDAARYGGRPYVDGIQKRWPDLKPLLDAFRDAGDVSEADLAATHARRPLYLQPTLERLVDPHALTSVGVVRKFGRPTDDTASANQEAALWNSVLRQISRGGPLVSEARDVLLWIHFLQLNLTLRQGLGETAQQVANRWRSVLGSDPPERLLQLTSGLVAAGRIAKTASRDSSPFRTLELAVRRAYLSAQHPEQLLRSSQ
jgi:hypothetical protein